MNARTIEFKSRRGEAVNHAGKANEGEFIRAYEFQPCEGRPDSFHEGLVVNANFDNDGIPCYVICCTRHESAGEVVTESQGVCVFVPHRVFFSEYANRITKIEAPRRAPRQSFF